MARTENRYNRLAAWWFVMAMLTMVGGIAGCATTRMGEAQKKVIWHVHDQYVNLEKQDRPASGGVSANAHPADIPADRLRVILESMAVRLPGEEKDAKLFNDEELKILSENIHTGLTSAGQDEDVTFAIIGHYPALMGLVKERMVTTGRVFCQGGEINIIFGDVHRALKENEDRRLQPFLPGMRGATAPREWRLSAKAGSEPLAVKRPDWVIFPIAGPTVPAVVPATPRDSGGTGTEKKAAPAISAGKRSIEERLMILNDLHNKKLITDKEYLSKRLEIINEL